MYSPCKHIVTVVATENSRLAEMKASSHPGLLTMTTLVNNLNNTTAPANATMAMVTPMTASPEAWPDMLILFVCLSSPTHRSRGWRSEG